MASSPSVRLREAGTSKPVRRAGGRRLSATHILIAIVVILAFVLNLLVLRDRSATTLIAVADRPLAAGSTFNTDGIRLVSVDADFEGLQHLVTEQDLRGLEGWVLERSIAEGELLDFSALVEPGASPGLRSMSVPVPVEHAAGGLLREGDRVDVISVVDGLASFVASDLEVLSVAESTGAAIGSTSGFHLVLAVDAKSALRLAEAIESGSIEVVRSTGAPAPGEGG